LPFDGLSNPVASKPMFVGNIAPMRADLTALHHSKYLCSFPSSDSYTPGVDDPAMA
jgi:hypothetical protein